MTGSLGSWSRGAWLILALAVFNVGGALQSDPDSIEMADASPLSGESAGPTEPSPTPDWTETPPASAEAPSPLLDPQVVLTDTSAWAVGSSVEGRTMPRFERDGDNDWVEVGEALRREPAWAARGFIGPSVFREGDRWWLFFSAESKDTNRYCIGAASTKDPARGFEPEREPLHCADSRDVIDPSPYQSRERLVLVWTERGVATSEGNDSTEPDVETWTIMAGVADLGAGVVGDPTELLRSSTQEADDRWDAGVVDAPALLEVDGELILLYAGNRWGTAGYATGYATCADALGPCKRRTTDEPLLIEAALDESAQVQADPEDVEVVATAGLQPVVTTEPGASVSFHGLLLLPDLPQASGAATFTAKLSWRNGRLAVVDSQQLLLRSK